MDQKEYTPGFKPPRGARIEAIAQQLAQSTGVSRKRRRDAVCEGVSKRARYEDDFVPETPEKAVTRLVCVCVCVLGGESLRWHV